MVDYVNDAGELARRIRLYAFGGQAPEELAARLQSIPGVTADLICEAGELLYAHRDLLDDGGLTLLGEIYVHAEAQGWTTFNQGDRSARIVAGVKRDLGETGGASWPASEDPEPQIARRGGQDWRADLGASEAAG